VAEVTEEYKGMSPQVISVLTYETVQRLERKADENEARLRQLELDFERFKVEVNTRIKTYTTLASAIATALGSIASFLIQHFVK
jgi:septation ring formation regulator EzrA